MCKISINYLLSPFFILFFISIGAFFFFFFFFGFYNIIIDLFNTDNHSKTLAFKKFKHFHKYCPKYVKTSEKHPNKFDIRQFLVLLYDCVPNIKDFRPLTDF